jgi:aminoglycoside phosphotransferase (APT) family kinase protein
MQPIEGVDADRVTDWFRTNIPGVEPPLTFELIAGGRSNLTFKVTDATSTDYVLRRPPTSHVLPTAHDMGREFRIISALQDTPVPVAPSLGFCDDESVNGRPFYVMGYVEGHILRDAVTAEKVLDEAGRRRAGESLVDVLADIHAVDVDSVGLGQLGRKEGYIERQLKRWYSQYKQSQEAIEGRTVPIVDEMHDMLSSRIPAQGPAAIVHGDYRLDNTMLGDDGSVRAVLDWEICTLGDPLADLGLLMVYWAEPGENSALLGAPTAIDGFSTRDELRHRYAERSGRNVDELDFYVAFGYWKLACILEGVYSRYAGGAMGGDRSGFEGFAEQVVFLAEASKEAADRL